MVAHRTVVVALLPSAAPVSVKVFLILEAAGIESAVFLWLPLIFEIIEFPFDLASVAHVAAVLVADVVLQVGLRAVLVDRVGVLLQDDLVRLGLTLFILYYQLKAASTFRPILLYLLFREFKETLLPQFELLQGSWTVAKIGVA
jgi:hypothetical protein